MRSNTHLLSCALTSIALLSLATAASAQSLTPTPTTSAAPELGDVHRAALRFHGLDGDLDRWSRRARLTGLVPSIELQAGWRGQQDRETTYREDQRFDALGAASIASRDQVRNELDHGSSSQQTYGIKLRLDPGALIFDQRELQSSRHAHQLALHRSRLLDRISDLYFERERARTEHARCRPRSSDTCHLLLIDVRHHDARLDALTGGWWSEHLKPAPAAQKRAEEVLP